ncbi:MAG: radical SAM protein [Candidatus Omnitrophota bacterium]|nr:MAG: radical SAM protein [Candidatus Omnitrophota bacterium]
MIMRLITPFDPWRGELCTCPKKFSLSPYTGCEHRCLYCYASSYIKDFYKSREKKNYIDRLQKEIKKIPEKAIITIANSSDPYIPLEKKLNLTNFTLRIFKNYNFRVIILTKSSLILRDIQILKELNVVISISLTTLKEKLAKRLEPFASSPKERLEAIETLSKYLPVVVRFDPIIYPLNTREIKSIIKELKIRGVRQIITSTYKVKPDNLKRMNNIFSEYRNLWHTLYIEKGERIGGYLYLPKSLRKSLIQQVREYTLKEGMDFSSCREGFKKWNTRNCDGSSFLS